MPSSTELVTYKLKQFSCPGSINTQSWEEKFGRDWLPGTETPTTPDAFPIFTIQNKSNS